MFAFEVGTKILGHLIDFDASTPHTQVTLERTAKSILLSLTWTDSDSSYARWFWGGPNPSEESHVPSQLLVQHGEGTVLLVGCKMSSARGGAWGPSTGVISAKYAVIDVVHDVDWDNVNGLQSLIPGLRAWLGVQSITMTSSPRTASQARSVSFVALEGTPITIGGDNNLRLLPTWRVVPGLEDDATALLDEVVCESTNVDLHSWSHYLTEHRAIRDLLLLSSWTSQELVPRAAFRLELEPQEDGTASMSGYWRDVESATPEGSRDRTIHDRNLIEYSDIKLEGIREWITLRSAFARAIDPVISSKLFRNPTIEVNLFLVAMGLEALGYLVAIERGDTAKGASDMRFSQSVGFASRGFAADLAIRRRRLDQRNRRSLQRRKTRKPGTR
jgi:hypothetical protein